jgi:hypothetical protein
LGFPLRPLFPVFLLFFGLRGINFKRPALSGEMSFLAAVETLSFFLLNWPFFLYFLSEGLLSFSENLISFLVYLVGMSFGFSLLKISILVISLIFLEPFSEIII